MKKYAVIGGQYQAICYGVTDSLHYAKMLASRHMELWDNWQGWHYPRIYMTTDIHPYTLRDGTTDYAPNMGAEPVGERCYGGNWIIHLRE